MSQPANWVSQSFDSNAALAATHMLWIDQGVMQPSFRRGDVAQILNCSPLTVSNREKTGRYPAPRRTSSGYRVYSIQDVLHLQWITYKQLILAPILGVLYDKGYTNPVVIEKAMRSELSHYKTTYIDPVLAPVKASATDV